MLLPCAMSRSAAAGGQLLSSLPPRVHGQLVLDESVPAARAGICRPVGVTRVVDVDGSAQDAEEVDERLLLGARGLEDGDHVDEERGEGRVLPHRQLPLHQLFLLVERSWRVAAEEEGQFTAHLCGLELPGNRHPHRAEAMVEAAGEAAQVGEDAFPLSEELNLGEHELEERFPHQLDELLRRPVAVDPRQIHQIQVEQAVEQIPQPLSSLHILRVRPLGHQEAGEDVVLADGRDEGGLEVVVQVQEVRVVQGSGASAAFHPVQERADVVRQHVHERSVGGGGEELLVERPDPAAEHVDLLTAGGVGVVLDVDLAERVEERLLQCEPKLLLPRPPGVHLHKQTHDPLERHESLRKHLGCWLLVCPREVLDVHVEICQQVPDLPVAHGKVSISDQVRRLEVQGKRCLLLVDADQELDGRGLQRNVLVAHQVQQDPNNLRQGFSILLLPQLVEVGQHGVAVVDSFRHILNLLLAPWRLSHPQHRVVFVARQVKDLHPAGLGGGGGAGEFGRAEPPDAVEEANLHRVFHSDRMLLGVEEDAEGRVEGEYPK
eukprot:766665-Hanusia_phi.AAC.4